MCVCVYFSVCGFKGEGAQVRQGYSWEGLHEERRRGCRRPLDGWRGGTAVASVGRSAPQRPKKAAGAREPSFDDGSGCGLDGAGGGGEERQRDGGSPEGEGRQGQLGGCLSRESVPGFACSSGHQQQQHRQQCGLLPVWVLAERGCSCWRGRHAERGRAAPTWPSLLPPLSPNPC